MPTSVFSSKELDSIRADIARLLPSTCSILSVTQTSDGQGGLVDSWSVSQSGIDCRIDPLSPREMIDLGQTLNPTRKFILTLPYDTSITTANRVRTSDGDFAVINVDDRKSWIATVRCEIEQI